MRTFKSGEVVLSKAEYSALVEALRRRQCMNDLGKGITGQWTGLGSFGAYKAAVTSGLMQRAHDFGGKQHTPNVPHPEWFELTEKGARIVAYWIGQGFIVKDYGLESYPSVSIPPSIL